MIDVMVNCPVKYCEFDYAVTSVNEWKKHFAHAHTFDETVTALMYLYMSNKTMINIINEKNESRRKA